MAGHHDMVADTSLIAAIGAGAGGGAGIVVAETLVVDRCRHSPRPDQSIIQRIADLIHARNDQNIFRTADNGRDPITVTINIHHFSAHA